MDPWLVELNEGHAQVAWDLFAERYRRLILATIKRLIPDHDDVMDVFSNVCQALSADDFARLRRYSGSSDKPATVATWLVVVVRNLTIDWIRHQHGRARHAVPSTLSPLQQAIYAGVCIDGQSYVQAYETIRMRTGSAMPFHEFLREVRATHAAAPCPGRAPLRRPVAGSAFTDVAAPVLDPAETADAAHRVGEALAAEPADVRLAIELFVVDRMPAADVARVVGWPNAKAVYNRVPRALAAIRARLDRAGISRGDL